MQEKTVLFIGGDMRQRELYEIFKKENFKVYSYGLFSEEQAVNDCDILILPFPCIKENKINSPYSQKEILPHEIYKFIKTDTKIFGGKLPKNLFTNNFVFDFNESENLTYFNAFLTAEAAIGIAIQNSKRSLFNSEILITGMGRISKHLYVILKTFNCKITICARKETDRAYAYSLGFNAINFDDLRYNIRNFDFVFNTVPSIIFSEKILKEANKETLFIDLASAPGGFEKSTDLNIITALALPGKYSPKSAAEIIYKTIRPFLNKEEKTWKT